MEGFLFWFCGGLMFLGGVMMVIQRNAVVSAVWLIFSFISAAGIFALLNAPFLAVMQVLVYAGAIMVLFVFVIMLLNLGPDASVRPAYLSVAKVLGALGAGYFTFQVIMSASGGDAGKPVDGSVKAVGTLLLSDYLFAFEAISVLLLVAVVGAVVLGLKRLT